MVVRCGQSTFVYNVTYLELQFTFLSWFHSINSIKDMFSVFFASPHQFLFRGSFVFLCAQEQLSKRPEHFGITPYKYIINDLYGKLSRSDVIICKINFAYFAISSEFI